MKIKLQLLIASLFILSLSSYAVEFELYHPCDKNQNLKTEIMLNNEISATTLTLSQVKTHKIPHHVNAAGLITLLNYGKENDIKIISDKNFIAYGWCYAINGYIPSSAPDQMIISNNDRITWFLGSSEYHNGQWVNYCLPIHENKESQDFYCQER